jgi:hypothetical protein
LGCGGETPQTPPAAGEVAHVLGPCARPHLCSAHVLGRTCARLHMCSGAQYLTPAHSYVPGREKQENGEQGGAPHRQGAQGPFPARRRVPVDRYVPEGGCARPLEPGQGGANNKARVRERGGGEADGQELGEGAQSEKDGRRWSLPVEKPEQVHGGAFQSAPVGGGDGRDDRKGGACERRALEATCDSEAAIYTLCEWRAKQARRRGVDECQRCCSSSDPSWRSLRSRTRSYSRMRRGG